MDPSGETTIGSEQFARPDDPEIGPAMRRAANGQADPTIVISADRAARHGDVVAVMEAARQSGYLHLTVLTRNPSR